MKQITPSDIRRAFEERERRIAASAPLDAVCSPADVVERINARQRRRRVLRKWCVALAATAAVLAGVLIIRPMYNPVKPGLASVIATYDSDVRDGLFVTSLTTEMNYADGASIVRVHNWGGGLRGSEIFGNFAVCHQCLSYCRF